MTSQDKDVVDWFFVPPFKIANLTQKHQLHSLDIPLVAH